MKLDYIDGAFVLYCDDTGFQRTITHDEVITLCDSIATAGYARYQERARAMDEKNAAFRAEVLQREKDMPHARHH